MVAQDSAGETHHWVDTAVLPHHTATDVGLLTHHSPGTHHAILTHLQTAHPGLVCEGRGCACICRWVGVHACVGVGVYENLCAMMCPIHLHYFFHSILTHTPHAPVLQTSFIFTHDYLQLLCCVVLHSMSIYQMHIISGMMDLFLIPFIFTLCSHFLLS